MQPFRHHVFACDQRKPEGAPCCSARGSAAVIDALREAGFGDIRHVVLVGPNDLLVATRPASAPIHSSPQP